jgi:hypothetical protein
MSPQTVTGHLTGCTLDSSIKTSRAYERGMSVQVVGLFVSGDWRETRRARAFQRGARVHPLPCAAAELWESLYPLLAHGSMIVPSSTATSVTPDSGGHAARKREVRRGSPNRFHDSRADRSHFVECSYRVSAQVYSFEASDVPYCRGERPIVCEAERTAVPS